MLRTILRKIVAPANSKPKATTTIEARIMAGQRVEVSSNQPTVFFFTVHKAASSYVGQLLSKILIPAGFIHADLNGYQFTNSETTKVPDSDVFQSTGFYYGPWRKPIDIDCFEKCQVILQLRHPLDVLTSYYFSIKHSHLVPGDTNRKQTFLENRQRVANLSIDQYVLEIADSFLETYQAYHEQYIGLPNVLTVHYEDMVTSFSTWLDEIVEFLQFDQNRRVRKTITKLKRDANFKVTGEDKNSHKRQVTPADHLRKLQPETIAILNGKFESVLETAPRSN